MIPRELITIKVSVGVVPRPADADQWFRYEGMEGKVFWIYEDLFRQAYVDGAHYFMMGNDDLRFETEGEVLPLSCKLTPTEVGLRHSLPCCVVTQRGGTSAQPARWTRATYSNIT